MKKILLLLMVPFIAQQTLHAQNTDSTSTITVDDYYIDFAVPDITAFSILDINSNDVVRPGNVKELAAGIQNYVDKDGNLKPGLAIEVAPYRLLAKSKKVASRWTQNKSLKNLQISFGTAQGDSTNLLAAWGINWTPVDRTDPVENLELQNFFTNYLAEKDSISKQIPNPKKRQKRLMEVDKFLATLDNRLADEQRQLILGYFNLEYKEKLVRYDSTDTYLYSLAMTNSVLAAFKTIGVTLNGIQNAALSDLIANDAKSTFIEYKDEQEFEQSFTAEVKRQKKIFIEENWNRLVIQFKGGGKYNSEENSISDLSLLNWRIFGGIAGRLPGLQDSNSPFAKKSQVIYQVNYTSYDASTLPLQWEFSTGGRLLYGKADRRISGELLYSQASVKGETTEKLEYIRYTIGGEVKLGEGFWLELAIGGQKFLEGDEAARVVPEFGLKYAIQKKSRF